MPYVTSINPSTGEDRYAGVEILNLFADLRLELESREVMEYNEKDDLYQAINHAEGLLRERLVSE